MPIHSGAVLSGCAPSHSRAVQSGFAPSHPRPLHRLWSAVLAAAALAGAGPAFADVTYTIVCHSANATFTSTVSGKPGEDRDQIVVAFGPISKSFGEIFLTTPRQEIRFNDNSKTYDVGPILGNAVDDPSPAGSAVEAGAGTETSSVQITDLGTAKAGTLLKSSPLATQLADTLVRGVKVVTTTSDSGCLGTGTWEQTNVWWYIPGAFAGLYPSELVAPTRTIADGAGRQITYELKGDVAALKSLKDGVPVSLVSTDSAGQTIMQGTIQAYSTSTVLDSLFSAPGGYTKVDPSQYPNPLTSGAHK